MIEALRRLGIRAEMHRGHQLVYTIPDGIAVRYGLQRMSNDEFDALFPSDDFPDDDACE